MGSGFPTQNYWPQLQLCHCQPHYVYVQLQEPNTEYFHPFMKPLFSDPNPRSQFGSSNSLSQRIIRSPEICLQFIKGQCNYGANCVFSHINPTPVNNITSIACSEERQDMINRSRICYWGKECPYGDRCKYLHVSDSVRPLVNFSVDEDNRMGFNGRKRPRFENSGSGERDMVQKYVDWRKTKLCKKWIELGSCPYGVNCCFAHGEEELRRVHIMEPENALSANNLDIVSKEAAVPRKKSRVAVSENGKKDGKCYFKWNSIEKISQVYADWIDDLSPPVQLAAV